MADSEIAVCRISALRKPGSVKPRAEASASPQQISTGCLAARTQPPYLNCWAVKSVASSGSRSSADWRTSMKVLHHFVVGIHQSTNPPPHHAHRTGETAAPRSLAAWRPRTLQPAPQSLPSRHAPAAVARSTFPACPRLHWQDYRMHAHVNTRSTKVAHIHVQRTVILRTTE